MACPSCRSNRQSVFPAEANIHFPGREGLDKPSVLVFPQMLICLECGLTQFVIPEAELREINEGRFRDRGESASA
jgi:hypothetical protein